MVSDITNFIRRNGQTPTDAINKILQDLAEIQPELKGDTKQERIVKVNEVYQVNQTATATQWTLTLDDETSVALQREDNPSIYLELGNA